MTHPSTKVATPIGLSGRLHMTKDRKKTYCGVWLHPSFWRTPTGRLTIRDHCADCRVATSPTAPPPIADLLRPTPLFANPPIAQVPPGQIARRPLVEFRSDEW